MVGRLLSFWGPAYFQGRTVSFKEVFFPFNAWLRIVQEAFTSAKGLLAIGGDHSPLTNKDIGSFVGECNNDAWRVVGHSCYMPVFKYNRPNTTTAMLTNFFKGSFKETLRSQPYACVLRIGATSRTSKPKRCLSAASCKLWKHNLCHQYLDQSLGGVG